jgi:hypothetical protein
MLVRPCCCTAHVVTNTQIVMLLSQALRMSVSGSGDECPTSDESYGSDSDLDQELLPEDEFQRLLKGEVQTAECRALCAARMRAVATASGSVLGGDVHANQQSRGDVQGVHVADESLPPKLPAIPDTVVPAAQSAPAQSHVVSKPPSALSDRDLHKLINSTRIFIGKLEGHNELSRNAKHTLSSLRVKLVRLEAEVASRVNPM